MEKSSEEKGVIYFGKMLDELLKIPEIPTKRNQANRSYANQKRGNFQGKGQANARAKLRELAKGVKDD
jgi:hypothetical protein